jgi:hypothetical protein
MVATCCSTPANIRLANDSIVAMTVSSLSRSQLQTRTFFATPTSTPSRVMGDTASAASSVSSVGATSRSSPGRPSMLRVMRNTALSPTFAGTARRSSRKPMAVLENVVSTRAKPGAPA